MTRFPVLILLVAAGVQGAPNVGDQVQRVWNPALFPTVDAMVQRKVTFLLTLGLILLNRGKKIFSDCL